MCKLMRDHGVLADGHGTSLRVVTATSSTQVDHSVAQPFYDVIITPVTHNCIGGLEI